MTKESLIESIKIQLKSLVNFGKETTEETVTEEVKAEEDYNLVLADGSKMTTKGIEFGEGVEVFVADEAGELVPASDGTYELEDGTKFTITAGKVTGIETGEEAPAETEDATTENEVKTEVDPVMEERIAKIEADIMAIFEYLDTLSTSSAAMSTMVEKMSKEPSVTPKLNSKVIGKETEEDKMSSILKKIKTKY